MSAIILFDGVCNFCNGWVDFVIRRDRKNLFKFAPLQSEIGQKLLGEFRIDETKTDSIVLISDGSVFTQSSAILQIARRHLVDGRRFYLNPETPARFFLQTFRAPSLSFVWQKRSLYDTDPGSPRAFFGDELTRSRTAVLPSF